MSCYSLEIVTSTIVSVLGVKTCHRENMPEDVVWQIQALKLVLSPLLEWNVCISDLAAKGSGELRRHLCHVQRSWPGEFVDFAYVHSGVRQNYRDNLSHVARSYRRRTSVAEWQTYGAVVRDRPSG
jgi:hypothetical protein